ncbi:hypothetical protein [Nocardia bhagyanarayanae]|uniref:hypothetical protein n=1 Tax=Nocardia bhagyanarayanae TaxID=1215925 RepID=UPI001FEBC52A|nr:hypothetical protein [Nocardia bhagyanarayanae]
MQNFFRNIGDFPPVRDGVMDYDIRGSASEVFIDQFIGDTRLASRHRVPGKIEPIEHSDTPEAGEKREHYAGRDDGIPSRNHDFGPPMGNRSFPVCVPDSALLQLDSPDRCVNSLRCDISNDSPRGPASIMRTVAPPPHGRNVLNRRGTGEIVCCTADHDSSRDSK